MTRMGAKLQPHKSFTLASTVRARNALKNRKLQHMDKPIPVGTHMRDLGPTSL